MDVAQNFKQLGLPVEFPNLLFTILAARLRVLRDLRSKGCDLLRLHCDLQAARRHSEEHDEVVSWGSWYGKAFSSQVRQLGGGGHPLLAER